MNRGIRVPKWKWVFEGTDHHVSFTVRIIFKNTNIHFIFQSELHKKKISGVIWTKVKITQGDELQIIQMETVKMHDMQLSPAQSLHEAERHPSALTQGRWMLKLHRCLAWPWNPTAHQDAHLAVHCCTVPCPKQAGSKAKEWPHLTHKDWLSLSHFTTGLWKLQPTRRCPQ